MIFMNRKWGGRGASAPLAPPPPPPPPYPPLQGYANPLLEPDRQGFVTSKEAESPAGSSGTSMEITVLVSDPVEI